MRVRYLLTGLVCLGGLLAAGCAPAVEPAPTVTATMPAPAGTPTPTTRPTTILTPAATATPLPDTLTPTFEPGTTPVWPTLSLPEVRASQTAWWADIYATTPTRKPTPTFTPIPGPVRPIVFGGVRCFGGEPYCSQPDLYELEWYQIYNDGSGLRRLPQLEDTEVHIEIIRFSPDGTLMAYAAWTEQGYHLFLADLHNSNPQEMAASPGQRGGLREFDFIPGTDCLVVWWVDRQRDEGTEIISVERRCPGQAEPELLGVSELPYPSYGYRLSPQGDAFLAISRDDSNKTQLYVQELGGSTPPRLLSTFEGRPNTSPHILAQRWQPDGLSIEFFLSVDRYTPYAIEGITVTRYISSRDGQSVETFPILEDSPYRLCCYWSPDDREILSGVANWDTEMVGVIIFDLETATWRPILSGYFPFVGPVWSPEMP